MVVNTFTGDNTAETTRDGRLRVPKPPRSHGMSLTMTTATSHIHGEGRILAGAIAAATVMALAGSSQAAAPGWLKRAFAQHGDESRTSAKTVARYRMDTGKNFVLDQTAPRPLLKFDDSPEVWVLSASRGPRGDMIYTSDLGRPLLRMTRVGGVTVFTPGQPDGCAAAPAGPGSPLRLTSVGPAGLYRALLQASAKSSHAARHLVGFEAPDADPLSDGLIADTANVASEAVATLSTDADGRQVLNRVTRISILRGARPGAALHGSVVDITITPAMGVAGRPSSQRILFAVGVR